MPNRRRGRAVTACPRRLTLLRLRGELRVLAGCGVVPPGPEPGTAGPTTPRSPGSGKAYSPQAGPGAKTTPEHARKLSSAALTILLVEDERALREIVKRQLTRHGYHVITASDGIEALEAAAGHDVDLVITDVLMPKMTGNELATELQAINPNARVIFMSGFTRALLEPEDNKSLLQKPFTEADLLDHIHDALSTDGDPDPGQEGGHLC
jgi:CheY-like chemotaxis protein